MKRFAISVEFEMDKWGSRMERSCRDLADYLKDGEVEVEVARQLRQGHQVKLVEHPPQEWMPSVTVREYPFPLPKEVQDENERLREQADLEEMLQQKRRRKWSGI